MCNFCLAVAVRVVDRSGFFSDLVMVFFLMELPFTNLKHNFLLFIPTCLRKTSKLRSFIFVFRF